MTTKTITPEIRERISHLYHGADIYVPAKEEGEKFRIFMNTAQKIADGWAVKYPLYLRSLADITDNEAVEVAKYMDWEEPKERDDFRYIRDELNVKFKYNWVTWVCVDYLRSIGIALPAFGFSIENLISAGVYRIKEKEVDNG